jgi:hypothetical protein
MVRFGGANIDGKQTGVVTVDNIHQKNHVWYVKWISSILMIITMSLTAVNIYPFNVFLGLISSIGWTYVSVRWNDRALIILNTIAVGIYLVGTLNVIKSI